MWAKCTTLILIITCLGCSANSGYFGAAERERQDQATRQDDWQGPALPMAAQGNPTGPEADIERAREQVEVRPAGREDVKSLEDAVDLITLLEYAKAVNLLRPLPARFEVSGMDRHAAEALFWLGYAHERLQQIGEARTYYDRVIRAYPETAPGSQARARLQMILGQ